MEEIEQAGTGAAADASAAGETANATVAEQADQVDQASQASQDQTPIDPSKNGEAGKPLEQDTPPLIDDSGPAKTEDPVAATVAAVVPEEAHSLLAEIEGKLHHLDLLPAQTAEFFKGKFSALSKILKAL